MRNDYNNNGCSGSLVQEEETPPALAQVVTQESSEEKEEEKDPTTSIDNSKEWEDMANNWASLTIENFVSMAQNGSSASAIKYHMAFLTAKPHMHVSADSTKLETYDTTAIHSILAKQGLTWRGKEEWKYIQQEFELLREGLTKWLNRATEALLRGDNTPHAYLARSNQENKFQILYARGQVLTPHDCEKESRSEGAWTMCTMDGCRKHKPEIAQPDIGKKHEKMFLDKICITSCDKTLRDLHNKERTMIVSTLQDTFPGVPLLCPLPWTWVATLQLHPSWWCCQTSCWIAQHMLAWPRSKTTDDAMEDVQSMIWKFLCAAASASSTKKPNCRNFLTLGTLPLDAGLDLFLRNHAAAIPHKSRSYRKIVDLSFALL